MKIRDLFKNLKTIYYKLGAVASLSLMKGTNMLDNLSPAQIKKLDQAVRIIARIAQESKLFEAELKDAQKKLNEFKFRMAKDSDWPSQDRRVAVFNPNDDYRRKGKTHGSLSHSIKHFMEFEPSAVGKVLNLVEKWMQDADHLYIVDKNNNVVAQDEAAHPKLSQDIVLNTLDHINDKMKTGKTLHPLETKIYRVMEKLQDHYKKRIKTVLNRAESIERKTYIDISRMIKNKVPVKFKADYFGNERTYVFDPKDTGLVSLDGSTVQTYFRVDKSGEGVTPRVKQYLTKNITPYSEHFKNYLETV